MIRDDKLRKYLEKFGKRGEMTLSVLGKDIDFIEALNSEIGHELLKDLAERHERLLNVISEIKATDEEKIEYLVVRRMLLEWGSKISNYNKKIDEIQKM